MFELPKYTGCDPDYVESSLNFYNYHAARTMSGKDRETALAAVRERAEKHGIKLKKQEES